MDYISTLIYKYLSGRYSSETGTKVQKWLTDEKYAGEKNRALQRFWNSIESTINCKTYQSLARIKKRLGIGKPARKTRLHNTVLRLAAGFLPLLLISL